MTNLEISDNLFWEAVAAIDSGDIATLKQLVEKHPQLVAGRLNDYSGGYFKDPFLLWFIADNPIRNAKLASNITDITALLIALVKQFARESAGQQLDYALGLVATGRIPRESGMQLQLMDLLIDAGAHPGNGLGALANGNTAAARHLIKRGGKMTLAAATVLDLTDEVNSLLPSSSHEARLTALAAAAFYGKTDMVKRLLDAGVDPNGYPEASCGFHGHGTPLHQAVSAGSADCVRLLVEAGANLAAEDKIYGGTPLGWAEYAQNGELAEEVKSNYTRIEAYLRNRLKMK